MKPKYTDEAKYPSGYTKASATDIRKTFARIRKQQAEEAKRQAEIAAEARQKVTKIARKA